MQSTQKKKTQEIARAHKKVKFLLSTHKQMKEKTFDRTEFMIRHVIDPDIANMGCQLIQQQEEVLFDVVGVNKVNKLW